MWRVVLVLACASCQELFHLEHVSAADPDASPCGVHDEDGDGVPDPCDNCPTVKNPDQANQLEIQAGAAADAVGDACDPNPTAPGDVIARFWPFTTADGFDVSGAIVQDDAFVLAGNSGVLSQAPVSSPSLAVIDVSWGGATDTNNTIELRVAGGDIRCGSYICTPGICMEAGDLGGGESTGIAGTYDQVTAISMASDGTCTITRGALGHDMFGMAYPYSTSKVGFDTTGTTTSLTVHSLIVYGH